MINVGQLYQVIMMGTTSQVAASRVRRCWLTWTTAWWTGTGEFIRRFAAMAKRPQEEVERVVRNRQKFEIEEGSDVPSAREVSSICRIVCVCVCTCLFICI